MISFADEVLRRYSRQILLREVGGRGQERILAARASLVYRGFAGEIAADYLRRAGVAALDLNPADGPLRALAETAPSFTLGSWDTGSNDAIFWGAASPNHSLIGHSTATLQQTLSAWPEGQAARGSELLVGAALALLMLQSLLGLQPPTLIQL